MGRESEAKTSIQDKHISIIELVVLVVGALSYIVSASVPTLIVLILHVPFDRQADPEVVNGIITASAILFGFSTLEEGRIRSFHNALRLIIFFVQILVVTLAGLICFVGYLRFSYLPISGMVGATTSLLINFVSWALIRILDVTEDKP